MVLRAVGAKVLMMMRYEQDTPKHCGKEKEDKTGLREMSLHWRGS